MGYWWGWVRVQPLPLDKAYSGSGHRSPSTHPSLSLLNSSPIPPPPPPALFSPLQLSKPPDASDVEAANAVEEVKRLRALIRTHSEGAKAATLMSAALDTEEGKAELRKVGYE